MRRDPSGRSRGSLQGGCPFLFVLLASTLCGGCGESNSRAEAKEPDSGSDSGLPSGGHGADGGEADSGGPSLFPSQLPGDFACQPTMTSIRTTIFETSCGWDTCHGDNDAAWGLRLVGDDDRVAEGMIDVSAGTCDGWDLVAPGDAEASYLYNKLAEREPACGEPMPRGVEPLPEEALQCIRGWIESL